MRRTLILVFLLIAAASWADEADRQRIRLRILDDNTPKAGVTVKVTFPDGQRTTGTTLTLVTNSAGFVEADIPSTVFWVTVPEENPDVVGREFRFTKKEKTTKRWDLRPREWKNEAGENQQ